VDTWDDQTQRNELLKKRKNILESDDLKFVPHQLDEMDLEYDQGKKKKVKKNKFLAQKENPFQRKQDFKNSKKVLPLPLPLLLLLALMKVLIF